MTQLLLIRHAVNDYVKTGKLAGWLPGVHLNAEGQAQAQALGQRLAHAPLRHIYASPLERTMETAAAIQVHHPALTVQPLAEIGEVRYGDWEGMSLSVLRGRKMWQVIQEYPSRAEFPNGETLRGAQTRMIDALEKLVSTHPGEMLAVVSHADMIKMAVAHYLGTHLDNFQRIEIAPASVTTLILGHSRPYVATVNDMAHVLDLKRQNQEQPHGKN
ncbi:MAG: MSMEG_4193 family putative phosphomutase [Anaerolineae bacterium]|jgi:probable phosphoglycerate mutase|nr:MSMEG_4193 family putative phosphomutase [Anaerolineae bacterium]